jgi:predicted ATPase/DNA-binding SARP family transcriptional activator
MALRSEAIHVVDSERGGKSANAPVLIQVFGGLQLAGQPDASAGIAKGERALLAYLLINSGRPVSVDAIQEALWPGDPPASAVKIIQIYVSHLRRRLGRNAITRFAAGYRLEATRLDLEVARFETAVSQGSRELRANNAAGALIHFDDALRLAESGEAFADLADYEFVRDEADRLDELRWVAEEGHFDASLALGREREIIAELQHAVRVQPLRERLWESLLLTLYRLGRQSDALDAYQTVRGTLASELGIEPGPRLEELQRSILQQDPGLVGPRDGAAPTGNLSKPSKHLIGRTEELGDLVDLLHGDAHLITLTGPGGTGKTQLALTVAAQVGESFADGTYFVDLSAVRDDTLALTSIGQTLGATGPLEARISAGRVLLVLDNLEQIASVAEPLARLLVACPNLRVLATSRVALHLSAECEYAVGTLPTESAVELFIERARAVNYHFVPDASIAEICRRVDGLPLAIELAAARAKVLSTAAILQQLSHRLAVLTGGPRDAPRRHQTLAATIAWSHELLDPPDAALFRRLAIFAGGFTLEAAIDVCDASLDQLATLVDHSLVRRESDRFSFLETIRDFAGEELSQTGEAEAVRARHARYFHDLVERVAADGDVLRQVCDTETDNIRAALSHLSAQPSTEEALDMAKALGFTWYAEGRLAEGDDWFTRALARSDRTETEEREWALVVAGEFPRFRGEWDRAESLKLQALAIARRLDLPRRVASDLCDLGSIAASRGDEDLARERFEESLSIRRRLGLAHGLAFTLSAYAELDMRAGRPLDAVGRLEEAVALLRELGVDAPVVGDLGVVSLIGLAEAQHQLGQLEAAAALFEEGLELGARLGLVDAGRAGIEGAAGVLIARGRDEERAARLLGAAARSIAESGFVDESAASRERTERGTRAALGHEAYEARFLEGGSLTLVEAIDLARDALRDLRSSSDRGQTTLKPTLTRQD